MQLGLATLGAPWGELDVWPDSNWILAPGTVAGMLKKVFDWQINRLFWPQDFMADKPTETLPAHVRALLQTRLKSVYYYNTPQPDLEIHVTQAVEDIVYMSTTRLPENADTAAVTRQAPRLAPAADNAFPLCRALSTRACGRFSHRHGSLFRPQAGKRSHPQMMSS